MALKYQLQIADVSTECSSCHQCLMMAGAFSQNIGKILRSHLDVQLEYKQKISCESAVQSAQYLHWRNVLDHLQPSEPHFLGPNPVTRPNQQGKGGARMHGLAVIFKNDIFIYRSWVWAREETSIHCLTYWSFYHSSNIQF